jgi:hypothetical protein
MWKNILWKRIKTSFYGEIMEIEAIVKETYSVCHIVRFNMPVGWTLDIESKQKEIDDYAIYKARQQSDMKEISLFDVIIWKQI